MSDAYRLVFRGEVLEGQHPAVVRKRLGQVAEFDDAALDKLFSGRPVIVKRAADTQTAARLQGLFRKAGARLRVLPVEGDEPADSVGATPDPVGATPDPVGATPDPVGAISRSRMPEKNRDLEIAPTARSLKASSSERAGAAPAVARDAGAPAAETPAGGAGGFEVLPPGADILRADERAVVEPRTIDTSGLSLDGARFVVPPAPPPAEGPPNAPDVSHLTVASVGTNLGPAREQTEPVPAPELSLAAPGELLAPQRAAAVPLVDSAGQFEVAPAGVELDQRRRAPVPAAPNVSHLELSDPD